MPSPINPSWIEEGDPRATAALVARSTDGSTSTFLWECTAGKFTWRYGTDGLFSRRNCCYQLQRYAVSPLRPGRHGSLHEGVESDMGRP